MFVDGCFWHQCPRHAKIPSNNRSFWASKLARNVERDRATSKALRSSGWRVIRIWEHELGEVGRPVRRVTEALARASLSD